MKLRKESWLHLAKNLNPNTRRYYDHVDCGAGRTLVVSADENGWSAHCFRCNADGFEPYGTRNLSELQNVHYGLLQRKDIAFEKGSCKLPADFTKEIPDYAAIWLYKAGIFKSTAEAYGFGWSDSIKRVVLPLYENGRLVYMQARSIDGRKPKYLNNSACSKSGILFKGNSLQGSTVVITEDILSAVRVSSLSIASVSTLGTQVSTEHANWIAQRYSKAVFWYDGDEAGRKGAENGTRLLSLLGVVVKAIRTTQDPKTYSNREILNILKEHI